MNCTIEQCEGEGWNLVTEVPEAFSTSNYIPPWNANTCDNMPPASFDSAHGPPRLSSIQKRSFQRACKRAMLHGYSWYKGQCLRPQDVPSNLQTTISDAPKPERLFVTSPNRAHAPRKRLTVFHWNGTGMSQAKMDELCYWLDRQHIHVATICETRWTFSNTWQNPNWSFVHTGDSSDRGAGVLVLIHKRLCHPSAISWCTILDGRLLHVRLFGQSRPIDIVACYQHMDDKSRQRLTLRHRFWSVLDDYIHKLPRRNMLVICGDFNCGVIEMKGHVGDEFFTWNRMAHAGQRHPDTAEFMSFIREHGLVALNTWSRLQGPTFVHGEKAARIDFLLTRTCHTDGDAKKVIAIQNAPFIENLHFGHVPLLGSLPFYRIQTQPHMTVGFSLHQRNLLRQEWTNSTPAWQALIQDACSNLDRQVTCESSVDPIAELHSLVIPRVKQTLSDIGSKSTLTNDSLQHLDDKWFHLTQARREVSLGSGTQRWFRCWFHLARFQALKRFHQRYATQRRRLKLSNAIHEANLAASRHDSYRLFQIIRALAPKVPTRHIHLRNTQGALSHPHESHALLCKYVHNQWGGHTHTPAQTHVVPGVPFTLDELKCALESVPSTKAVAKPFMPGVVVKHLACSIAERIFPLLQLWWNQSPPYMPPSWRDGWLIFLAKPGKTPDRPDNLRPLAMQEPIGKAITGLLTERLLDQVFPNLCVWPQFAYLPFRSTQDAIRRVVLHCTETRRLSAPNA